MVIKKKENGDCLLLDEIWKSIKLQNFYWIMED